MKPAVRETIAKLWSAGPGTAERRSRRRRRSMSALASARERDEAADDRAVGNVRDDRRQRRLAAVVEHEESGRLEQRRRAGGSEAGAHPRMHDREQDVDEGAAGEERMHETEERAQQEATGVDDEEDHVVGEGEEQTEAEVEHVAERLRAHAVGGHRRPEQEGKVHPRQAELARRPQESRQHQRAGKTADQRAPDHARASSIERAALISARCESPCGKLPRKSPVAGSISSAKRPTSLASGTSSSISAPASSRRPWRAYASTSQNEQATKAPSSPGRPSSPR